VAERPEPGDTIGPMRYELYMSHALSKAAAGSSHGERLDGAVVVLDDAMVASGSDQVQATGDPTAHAVVVALREAASRLGTPSLAGVTVFAMVEPCAMCFGALQQSDVDGLVFAVPDPREGACGSVVQLADAGSPRRLRVVSGILQQEALDLQAQVSGRLAGAGGRSAGR